MNQNRLRISIIGLLAAVAIASFGCGGGSGAGPATSGGFNSAVIPDVESTPRSESGNPNLGNPPSNGGGDNGSDSSPQNTQTAQKPVPDGHELVDFQEEDAPLPWEHGLGAGEIVVSPGKSEEHGNMVITCPPDRPVCIIHFETDGLVTYLRAGGVPSFTLTPPEGFPAIPLPQPNEAVQAPVVELDFGNTLHVGAGVAPLAEELTTGVDRSGVRVSYGDVQHGIKANRVLEFMQQHVRLEDKIAHSGVGTAPGLETYPEPPTIRLAEGTSDLYARFAAHAVQLINGALPYEKRITLGAGTLPAGTELGDVPEGEILLEFGSLSGGTLGVARLLSSYHVDSNTNEQKVQQALRAHVTINEKTMREAFVYAPPPGEEPTDFSQENWKTILEDNWGTIVLDSRVENSDTIIKWFNDRIFLSVVVHELMHALGFYHTDETRNSESIMHPIINEGQENVYSPYLPENTSVIVVHLKVVSATDEETTGQPALKATRKQTARESSQGHLITPDSRAVPGHILFPIDRAALLAAYGGRLDPGTQPDELTAENLGAWTDTSFHLRGDVDIRGGGASFGVASSNGLIQPWASGPTPWTNLRDNNQLSGSATWSGALLGITPSSETVAGDASLSVNLSSLNGGLAFTNMEKWGVNEAPGAVGSGATWGDGDLGYAIQIRGNTFIQTGGDDGNVTGAFFGAAHEAMGGVLERADLAAGFGGRR